eukprot:TRINITY_DN491_c0_g1_i1.p2 TRINITY_DN491_c0_g1~~TRINITY_DN491_c0_g1_i1.p2  ORF type:complete len:107 (+),score=0.75 TRINITY_DN491_c0_g1_i1:1457-1777(+)
MNLLPLSRNLLTTDLAWFVSLPARPFNGATLQSSSERASSADQTKMQTAFKESRYSHSSSPQSLQGRLRNRGPTRCSAFERGPTTGIQPHIPISDSLVRIVQLRSL